MRLGNPAFGYNDSGAVCSDQTSPRDVPTTNLLSEGNEKDLTGRFFDQLGAGDSESLDRIAPSDIASEQPGKTANQRGIGLLQVLASSRMRAAVLDASQLLAVDAIFTQVS